MIRLFALLYLLLLHAINGYRIQSALSHPSYVNHKRISFLSLRTDSETDSEYQTSLPYKTGKPIANLIKNKIAIGTAAAVSGSGLFGKERA
jgi:hypothetical protein